MTGTPLNPSALLWVTFASVLVDGLFIWPLHAVMIAGQNAVIAVALGIGWGLSVAVLSPADPTLSRISPVFSILNGVGAALMLVVDGATLTELAGMLQTFYYFATPRWVMETPLVVLVASAAMRPGAGPWRVVTLWVPPLAVGGTAMLMVTVATMCHLRPMLPNTVVLVDPVVQAVGIFAYVGLSIGVTVRSVGPLLAKRPSWIARMVAVALPLLFFGALYAIAIGALGPEGIVLVRWPLVFVLDHVSLGNTFFLSRVGIAVVLTWAVGIATGLIVHLSVARSLMPRPWPTVARWMPVIVVTGWWVAGLLFPSPQAATHFILAWMNPLAGLYMVGELGVLGLHRVLELARRRQRRRAGVEA